MNTKYCPRCKENLPLAEFRKNSHHSDNLQTYCIECNKLNNKEHYQKNKQDYIDKAAKNKQKKTDYIRSVKKKSGCIYCSEKDVACLEFHHRDPSEKDFTISVLGGGRSYENIDAEIKKCDVLCANCHKKLHYHGSVS